MRGGARSWGRRRGSRLSRLSLRRWRIRRCFWSIIGLGHRRIVFLAEGSGFVKEGRRGCRRLGNRSARAAEGVMDLFCLAKALDGGVAPDIHFSCNMRRNRREKWLWSFTRAHRYADIELRT